jgi:hypothetical protein
MHLANYLTLLYSTEGMLGDGFLRLARRYRADVEFSEPCTVMAAQCATHRQHLATLIDDYARQLPGVSLPQTESALPGMRRPAEGLEREIRDVRALAGLVSSSWTVCLQAARSTGDTTLLSLVIQCQPQTQDQITWLEAQMQLRLVG